MDLLKERIDKIKETLHEKDLNLAASLLVSTMSSDEMFQYWGDCCQGSERVPKILKYIRHISFEYNVPTAVINFREGDLKIGIDFFMQYINGPEDLLFILVHERNHLILRTLYPDMKPEIDFPKDLFNFGEDVYVNAIARRYIPSTLPESFYNKSFEMLLTGKHSQIDWDYFRLDENGLNALKDAHGAMYKRNYDLLNALGEHNVTGDYYSGYENWMDLLCRWHEQMNNKPENESDGAISPDAPDDGTDAPDDELQTNENDGQADECTSEADGTDNREPEEENDEENIENDAADEKHDKGDEKSDNQSPYDDGAGEDKGGEQEEPEPALESEQPAQDIGIEDDPIEQSENNEGREDNIDQMLEAVVPLVDGDRNNDPRAAMGESAGEGKINGLGKIPMPRITPNDPIVRMILETCELPEFRGPVMMFEGDVMQHVDGLINGILSDRATERSYDGYSISVPFSLTRRDVFSLSAGQIPVMWQTRVGVERPSIDLYVDVSGSMETYYPFIPYIYSALKHVMGKIYQFSTEIVEVDHDDPYLHSTGGTNFNSVARHMIQTQVTSAILLSDGVSSLSNLHIESLKNQLENFVYIKVRENKYMNWEHVATQVIILLGS
jgi:hypothetical protein